MGALGAGAAFGATLLATVQRAVWSSHKAGCQLAHPFARMVDGQALLGIMRRATLPCIGAEPRVDAADRKTGG